jgi:carbon starvation protein CstA
VFTVGATIPIAMFMGGYLRFWRVGKVLEVSAIGVILLLLAVWGGQWVHGNRDWSGWLTFNAETIAWSILIYGLAASVLPVWLLLAPRDYLSTFMKLGTIFALAVGVFLVRPNLQMPAITRFIDGTGLVVPGKLFPFCFIVIACGAISGFHTLISSGITPKIITRESYARPIGYGAMCLESMVAIMAGTWGLPEYECDGRSGRHCAKGVRLGFPRDRGQNGGPGAHRGRTNSIRTHGRRRDSRSRHGPDLRSGNPRPLAGSVVSLRDHV